MTLRPLPRALVACLLLSLFGGCDGAPAVSGEDPCEAMADHLAACGVLATPQTCDEELAAEALSTSCAQLTEPGKADFAGALLCHVGVLSACEVPVCAPEAGPPPMSTTCSDYTALDSCGACDYYLCRDAQTGADGCGDDGYLVGFGFKYCERFTLITRAELSPAGQQWLDATRGCLQEEIERGVPPDEESCTHIEQVAYASHPSCYVDNGFCDLPLSDILSVAATVDPSDLVYQEVLRTGISCLDDVF